YKYTFGLYVHTTDCAGDAPMSSTTTREAEELEDLARRALAEDLSLVGGPMGGQAGDLTSKRIVRAELPCRARLLAKSPGVLAGTAVAAAVFRIVDPALAVDWKLADGDALVPDATVAELTGRARAALAGERVALNFL